jgi:transposase
MGQHLRGKLGPAGRRALVRLIVEENESERAAAAALAVAPATAHRWKHRWLAASAGARDPGSPRAFSGAQGAARKGVPLRVAVSR